MEKGSSCRKCKVCGKKIFYVIPTDESVLGIRIMQKETIIPYKATDKGYYCLECFEKLNSK